jgi:hypothetical protein
VISTDGVNLLALKIAYLLVPVLREGKNTACEGRKTGGSKTDAQLQKYKHPFNK